MNKPVVSIVIITYSHEKYIEEAINGVLIQNCNFDIELIIANDCSRDSTDKIIKNIIKTNEKAAQIIKYFNHEKNIGMMPNFIYAMEQCKGKYIALCEGDDYWTNPLKLQKQVDFLEANKDFVMCFHQVNSLFKNNKISINTDTFSENNEATFTIENLAQRNFISTPSVVFRNNIVKFPDWYLISPVGDYVLWMLLSDYGKIKYLPNNMAVYRVGVGTWSRQNTITINEKWIKVLKLLEAHFTNNAIVLKSLQNNRANIELYIANHYRNKKFLYRVKNELAYLINNYVIKKR